MSTAGELSDPAIEAVRTAIWERAGYKFSDESMRHVIEAMLDNLPRAEMAHASCPNFDCGYFKHCSSPTQPCETYRKQDAAIAAARETLLRGGRSKGKS